MFHELDFGNFYSQDTSERDEFCRQLVAGLKEHGFVKLINHTVPRNEIDNAFEIGRQFYELPMDEKMKSPHPPTANPHRGFTPYGVENVSAISNHNSAKLMPLLKDMKESYDIGSERDELWKNIWPPAGVLDTFQPTFATFFNSCYQAELTILEAISIGFGLPAQTLGNLHQNQSNELRVTHYPAVTRENFSHATRIAAHTDFGTITLLFQDAVGGLQVEYPSGSGTFVDIESGGPHECILNAGDCLQRWTGLNSARHRVHLPDPASGTGADPKESVVSERYSIAYFGKPDRDASLKPLIGGVAAGDGEKYMTAGEFQNFRIQGTY